MQKYVCLHKKHKNKNTHIFTTNINKKSNYVKQDTKLAINISKNTLHKRIDMSNINKNEINMTKQYTKLLVNMSKIHKNCNKYAKNTQKYTIIIQSMPTQKYKYEYI